MQVVATRPKSLTDLQFTYCPGCLHGVAHRLIAEVMDELDIRNETMGVAPVGCSVFAYKFLIVTCRKQLMAALPQLPPG